VELRGESRGPGIIAPPVRSLLTRAATKSYEIKDDPPITIEKNGYLKCYLANVRCERNKLNLLRIAAATFQHDLILSTETWLSSDEDDIMIQLPGYYVLRKDRQRISMVVLPLM